MPTIGPKELGYRLQAKIVGKLRLGKPSAVLVTQAKRRIHEGGDSQHKYPDLWDHPKSYRKGGQPLHDKGRLISCLHSTDEMRGDVLRMRLTTPLMYAVYHQHGFKTDGPNFIPLTLKAVRTHRKGQNPKEEGLIPGKDYIMAWKGVTVPQRKIFNLPPENVAEIKAHIAQILR